MATEVNINITETIINNMSIFEDNDHKIDKKAKLLEDEMDFYDLDEEEREAVLSGDYEPENFNLPGDEDLDEEDYHYEDDNLI